MIFDRFLALILESPHQERAIESVKSQFFHSVAWTTVARSPEGLRKGLEQLTAEPNDIVTVIDGSHWLYNERVFSFVHAAYLGADLLFTGGQYLLHERGIWGDDEEPTPKLITTRNYRRKGWKWRGLKTFRAKLFDEIRLPHVDGACLEASLLYPLVELAGPRLHFFPNVQLVCEERSPWGVLPEVPKYRVI